VEGGIPQRKQIHWSSVSKTWRITVDDLITYWVFRSSKEGGEDDKPGRRSKFGVGSRRTEDPLPLMKTRKRKTR